MTADYVAKKTDTEEYLMRYNKKCIIDSYEHEDIKCIFVREFPHEDTSITVKEFRLENGDTITRYYLEDSKIKKIDNGFVAIPPQNMACFVPYKAWPEPVFTEQVKDPDGRTFYTRPGIVNVPHEEIRWDTFYRIEHVRDDYDYFEQRKVKD